MSHNILVKILNFRNNKDLYNLSERESLIRSYRGDLQNKVKKTAHVLEGVIEQINK